MLSPLHVLALVALIGAAWAIDRTTQDNRNKADQIAELQRDASRDAGVIESQAAALGDLEELREQVRTIGAESRQLRTVLDAQAAQLRAGLEELKRDDQEARDYLASPVPAAVGLRYARPATADPAAYRAAAAGVRPGAVPAARAAGSSAK